ncbi:MAG: NUDIX domain-containing protein [Puniceicoccales bacterium]
MKFVRSAVRALIIRDGCLLTIQMRRGKGEIFYILPGGGQVHGETLEISLRRECLEEIGVEPIIGPIAYVREYIGRNHTFAQAHKDFHQIEVVFRCKLPEGSEPGNGHETDKHQIGYRWVPVKELLEMDFYPAKLKEYIQEANICPDKIYLGDIN